MSALKVNIALHKAKDIAHNLNTCRGLICKVYIEPNFKAAILAYLNDIITTLQEQVKIAERGGK